MAPTIESDENDLILKVITDAEQNLNCDFSLKTEKKSAIHAICKVGTLHHCMLLLVHRTYIKHTILFLNILTTQQT